MEQDTQELWDNYKRRIKTEAIFKAIMNDNFPQINIRHQAADPKLRKCKQDKFKEKEKETMPKHIIFKLQNLKDKKY